jgi:hypothetical protein
MNKKRKLTGDQKDIISDWVVRLLEDTVDVNNLEFDELLQESLFAEAELPIIDHAIKLLEDRKKFNEKVCVKALKNKR